MSPFGAIPVPGSLRITLVLLAVIPAVMAYPWNSSRSYWLLGTAVTVVVVLLGWWRGLHLTTILGRRLRMVRHRGNIAVRPESATTTTVLMNVRAAQGSSDQLPLLLIAGYLNRFGVRADKIRITNCSRGSDVSPSQTWIALTISAGDNLDALLARSPRSPLHETAEVAARRLAAHLGELGWDATILKPNDIPRLFGPEGSEAWRALQRQTPDFVAAYRIRVDDLFAETLEAVCAHAAGEKYIALELAGGGVDTTIAAACAFVEDAPPGATAPVAGLGNQHGNQRPALTALELSSTQRLEGHERTTPALLAQLLWPTPNRQSVHRAL